MKRVGLIGGIGPESTIQYYRLLIDLYRSRLETNQYPEIWLYSIDMTEMLNLIAEEQLEQLVEFLTSKVNHLAPSVDYVALASNTPHLVYDLVADQVDVELISIVEETCKVVEASGAKVVALLGTKFTMSKGFYQSIASKFDFEIVVPGKLEQNYIHEKYMSELVRNQIEADTKRRLIEIVQDLQQSQMIEGVILGGTELPLILDASDFDQLLVYNTTEIHVRAILDKMINPSSPDQH